MLRPPLVPPLTLAQCMERAQGKGPTLGRRLFAMLYEGVLLFGVVMLVALVFALITDQKHALNHRQGLQASVFLALSAYFIWFWVQGGQTLAMKTWHVRLVRLDGHPLTMMQAAIRYVLSWLWFLPPLGLAWVAHWQQTREVAGLLAVWFIFYASMTWLLPQRQSLHDLICRTRLIDTRP